MSLSNKILIGFFGSIFLYLTSVFLEIRLRGTPNNIDENNSKVESVDVSGISFLILQDINKNIQVTGSEQPRLEVRSLSGDALKKLKYSISGDTLLVSGISEENLSAVKITVFVPHSALKGIEVTRAEASIEGLQQDLLKISQNSGRIDLGTNTISKIEIDLSNKAVMEIVTPGLDSLSASLDNSKVYISSPLGLLYGSMKNSSYLYLTNIQEIQFKKDESSQFSMY